MEKNLNNKKNENYNGKKPAKQNRVLWHCYDHDNIGHSDNRLLRRAAFRRTILQQFTAVRQPEATNKHTVAGLGATSPLHETMSGHIPQRTNEMIDKATRKFIAICRDEGNDKVK
jgi:hypothetical protein